MEKIEQIVGEVYNHNQVVLEKDNPLISKAIEMLEKITSIWVRTDDEKVFINPCKTIIVNVDKYKEKCEVFLSTYYYDAGGELVGFSEECLKTYKRFKSALKRANSLGFRVSINDCEIGS